MSQTNSRLYAGGAAALLLAAGAGFGIARFTTPATAPPAAAPQEAAKPASGALTIAADVVQAAGVKVETVSAGGLGGEILASASVVGAPDGQAVLTAHAAGAVTRLYKHLGDPVRAGEVLALVESPQAAALAADRSVAKAKAALARQVLTRERRLFDQKVSPRQDVERAEAEAASAAAEVQRAQTAASVARLAGDGRSIRVTSPITGQITAAPGSLGAYVEAETELFRVADPARILVQAAVPAQDAQRIAPGDTAVVELADGTTAAAHVHSLSPALSAETRAAGVMLTLDTTQPLQPGQALRVRIRPKAKGPVPGVAVPDEAVQSVGGRDVVFLRTDQGFRAQPVTVGARSGGRVSVLAGLVPGQVIATRNAFLLKAELGKGEEG